MDTSYLPAFQMNREVAAPQPGPSSPVNIQCPEPRDSLQEGQQRARDSGDRQEGVQLCRMVVAQKTKGLLTEGNIVTELESANDLVSVPCIMEAVAFQNHLLGCCKGTFKGMSEGAVLCGLSQTIVHCDHL